MPRSYQVTPRHPRPATSDTAKGSQTASGRQPERESARRRSRSLHRPSDITDDPNQNSKPESSSGDPARAGERRDFAGFPRHAACFVGMGYEELPERRLMVAVLEDAIRTLLLARRTAVPRKRLLRELAWVESTSQTEPFAF